MKDNENIAESQGKNCPKCKTNKNIQYFYKNRSRLDGLSGWCIDCYKTHASESSIRYHAREEIKIRNKQLKQLRKEQNPSKFLKQRSDYIAKKRKSNLNQKLKDILCCQIYKAIKIKPMKTLHIVGCSLQDLKIHLEKQFTEGMCWNNYKRHGWHIDHILPIELFDLSDIRQLKVCFHYSNLQPLWSKDNLLKCDYLSDGRRASSLSPQEKLDYLRSLGYNL